VIYVRADVADILCREEMLQRLLHLQGTVYRAVANRRTICIVLGKKSYFVKIHRGAGWKEIFKNLFQGKRPILDASNEWRCLQKLQELGVASPRIAAYGMAGRNPGRRRSFVMTDAMEDVENLEEFCRRHFSAPLTRQTVLLKYALIRAVASRARALHSNGINHQDFYLCHLLLNPQTVEQKGLPPEIELIVSDLHRACVRRKTPVRAVIKDLAAVYFSSIGIVPLTRRDLFRFVAAYRQQTLRTVLGDEAAFWKAVEKRAYRVYRKVHGGIVRSKK